MDFVLRHTKIEEASEQSEFMQYEDKDYWPTWAKILVICCIILTLLAFFLGNLITKKNTMARNRRSTHQNMNERERKWGAGFSGGLWAAA